MTKNKKFTLKMMAVFVMASPLYAENSSLLESTMQLIDTLSFNVRKGVWIYQKDKDGNRTDAIDFWKSLRLNGDRLAKLGAIFLYFKSESVSNAVRVINNDLDGALDSKRSDGVRLVENSDFSDMGLRRLWPRGEIRKCPYQDWQQQNRGGKPLRSIRE